MGSVVRKIRRIRARRSQGRDVVVTVLFLLSCSEEHVQEIKREKIAEVTAPRRAHVERVTSDVVQTAGCGCKSIGGGRGSLIVPSCEETRCTNAHRTRYQCSLTVDESPPAETTIGCSEEKVSLVADERGQRFAYQTEEAGPWRVSVGGLAGHLFHPLGDDGRSLALDQPPATNGWAKVPPATTLLAALYSKAARDAFNPFPEREVLQELRALDPGGFVPRLAELMPDDLHFDECSSKRTAWIDTARALSPEERAVLDQKLGAFVDDDNASVVLRRHAFAILTPAALLSHFKDPAGWIRAHAAPAQARFAGIVLTAWSAKDPKAAATLGCALLAKEELPVPILGSALLAIGRANAKCAAVKNHLHRAVCRLPGEDDELLEPRSETEETLKKIEANGHRVDICESLREYPVALAVHAQGNDRATLAALRKLCRDDAPAEAAAPSPKDAARD